MLIILLPFADWVGPVPELANNRSVVHPPPAATGQPQKFIACINLGFIEARIERTRR